MLKKLSIAGLALITSSTIAFADTSDSMSTTDTMGGASSSNTADASMSNTSGDNSTTSATTVTPKKHKKHHHKKTHHKRHHHKHVPSQPVPAADPDPVASAAPMGSYKGEVPCPPAHPPFMVGPYVGAGIGSRVNYVSSPAVYNGLEGTLFAGYSMLWEQEWYGALELAVQDSAQITNNTSTTSPGSAKSSWSYGLTVIPGYMLADNVLGYLRLGVLETRFTTGSSNVTGGQLGLGMQVSLCTNWDLRGEYVYDFYNSISGGGSPKTQQFNLGLLYKFQL